MRIYRGIGPNRGRIIEGDEAAFRRLITEIGLVPIAGWEDVSLWFRQEYEEDLLDVGYSGNWIVYDNEDEYQQALAAERPDGLGPA